VRVSANAIKIFVVFIRSIASIGKLSFVMHNLLKRDSFLQVCQELYLYLRCEQNKICQILDLI